ncbi:MAG: undecaprenyl-phosphate glucose phosphotransferase [Burkholderiaceae bacterium]
MSPGTATVRTGNQSLLGLFQILLDRSLAAACLFLATWIWGGQIDQPELILAFVAFVIMPSSDLPLSHKTPGLFRQITGTWGLIIGILLVFGLISNTMREFDPNVLATWVVLTPFSQICVHVLLPYVLPRLVALGGEHVAIIVGANKLGRTLAQSISADPLAQTYIAGFFDDRAVSRLGDITEAPLLGGVDAVADFARNHRVHQIFIALPMASQPRILKLLDGLRDTTASIYFVPDVFMLDLIQARIDTVVGLPVVAVCETPFHGTTNAIKRLSDMCIALTAVILTSPLMIAVALAIKLTMPGPVLFKQRRFGLDGQEIIVWKFRSMKVAEDGPNVKQATKDDDRITPLGRFLRRTSLDELPQFFNVLQGKMSVVGPRPHAVSHNEMYRSLVKGYMIRHKVKPGITGLAQISGARGETDTVDKMELRIKYDLEYLRKWSLRLDLWIIYKTVAQVFKDPQAY